MKEIINKIHNCHFADLLKKIDSKSIDMILTSPPYDDLRGYEHMPFGTFKMLSKELNRVLKDGGVIVWNVGDATKNGTESGSSFRQALYFKDECGLNLHDTMIYEKNSSSFPARSNSNRYTQIFEYMFILSKGKPKTCNLICDKENKWAGHSSFDGKVKDVPDYSPRNNIWKYTTSFDNNMGHPAIMPMQMALDHIETWSNVGDVILDPFMGSGTTAYAASQLGREYIGSEINSDYADIANKRLSKVQKSIFSF